MLLSAEEESARFSSFISDESSFRARRFRTSRSVSISVPYWFHVPFGTGKSKIHGTYIKILGYLSELSKLQHLLINSIKILNFAQSKPTFVYYKTSLVFNITKKERESTVLEYHLQDQGEKISETRRLLLLTPLITGSSSRLLNLDRLKIVRNRICWVTGRITWPSYLIATIKFL